MDVHQLLLKQRLNIGLTQKEVANRLNIEIETLNKYETGALKIDIDLFLELAKILDITVSISPNTQLPKETFKYNSGIDENYIKEATSHPDLTAEEEKIIWEKIIKGDKNAKKQLILSYYKTVIPIAEKYLKSGMEPMDLINEGNIGLLKAVEHYDPAKGYDFSEFSKWWIRQTIIRANEDYSKMIRIPKNIDTSSAVFKVKKAKKYLKNKLNREPNANEIAIELNLSEEIVRKTLHYLYDKKEEGEF